MHIRVNCSGAYIPHTGQPSSFTPSVLNTLATFSCGLQGVGHQDRSVRYGDTWFKFVGMAYVTDLLEATRSANDVTT